MSARMKAALSALVAASTVAMSVHAADTPASTVAPDAATVDAIIRRMESSGALDAAVERAIDRYVQRKEVARQAEQAKRDTDLPRYARAVDTKQDHIRGNPSAEVSLIEYTDFECPFCKRFHDTPKALLDRYGSRVNWVIRNYPLSFHDPAAHKESLAAECVAQIAGNDVYWKYADALFANTRSNGSGLPDEHSVEKLAEAAGLKPSALATCMNDGAGVAPKRVERDLADGTSAGVSGTPTTIIRNNRTGGSQALVGAQPADAFVGAIDRMLNAKP